MTNAQKLQEARAAARTRKAEAAEAAQARGAALDLDQVAALPREAREAYLAGLSPEARRALERARAERKIAREERKLARLKETERKADAHKKIVLGGWLLAAARAAGADEGARRRFQAALAALAALAPAPEETEKLGASRDPSISIFC